MTVHSRACRGGTAAVRRLLLVSVAAAAAPAMGQIQEQELVGVAPSDSAFGMQVDVTPDGTWLVSTRHDGLVTGEAWVFRHDGVQYQHHATLTADRAYDEHGQTVAISAEGTVVAIGAAHVDATDGTVDIYRRSDDTWTHEVTLLPGVGEGRLFGSGVDLSADGSVLVAGAPLRVYRHDGENWNVEFDGAAFPLRLGTTVAIDASGTRIAAGSPRHTPVDGVFESGAVRVFAYEDDTWTHQALLENPDPFIAEWFGNDGVAIDGDVLVVGNKIDNEVDVESGAAYVYEWDGTAWSLVQKLVPDPASCGSFCGLGSDVAVLGDRVLVRSQGQPHPDNLLPAASASLYRRGDVDVGEAPWVYVTKIFRDVGRDIV
ncbi:MAG: hypothetical protein HKO59_05855, partial [Phycisphaerales bacterium]|nr:hypothetical protein [Phycisphaerales bacterium]